VPGARTPVAVTAEEEGRDESPAEEEGRDESGDQNMPKPHAIQLG